MKPFRKKPSLSTEEYLICGVLCDETSSIMSLNRRASVDSCLSWTNEYSSEVRVQLHAPGVTHGKVHPAQLVACVTFCETLINKSCLAWRN